MYVYLESTTSEGVRFEVVSYDKATKTATLKGGYGAQFDRNISKEELEKRGYKLVQSKVELPLVSEPKVKAAPKKKAVPVVETEEEE